MMALRGETGAVVWGKPVKHDGPAMIHGETIYLGAARNEGAAVELLTGNAKTRLNPLTGRPAPWNYRREYGCNSVSAGEYLFAFRSGTAGYYDLAGDGGTGSLGGFRSGCTSNLVIADGVLNAPDYTRTCNCTYPNQTSLAFVHSPDAEMWTFNPYEIGDERITRVGINFGAPGDRRAADGTLWLEYPSVGGASPAAPIEIDPAPSFFCRNSLRYDGEGPAWVGASGLVGGGTISLRLAPEPGEKRDQPNASPQEPTAGCSTSRSKARPCWSRSMSSPRPAVPAERSSESSPASQSRPRFMSP
ncbi:MAG: hypothetical protein NTW96_20515, partial [Planctomycetia bacterium]|nr:hypothetical protein [Planctomycetia bacterium]